MVTITSKITTASKIPPRLFIKLANDNKLITVRDTTTGNETVYDVESTEGLYNYLYDMYHHDD